MKTFKQFLLEKTFNINRDVDMIYNKYYKKYIDAVNKTDHLDHPFYTEMMSSVKFTTKDAKKAHEVNPIVLYFHLNSERGSFYLPLENIIEISLNNTVFNMVKSSGSIDKAIKEYDITSEQEKAFRNEFSESKMKQTIYHELSHWIDDSLHNRYITKNVLKAKKEPDIIKRKIIRNQGKKTISASDIEINAIIHNIKQAKRLMSSEEWDNMTLEDLMYTFPSTMSVISSVKRSGEWGEIKKKILSRMNRENLLGKNMNKKVIQY